MPGKPRHTGAGTADDGERELLAETVRVDG
jgi:hypothetical protein